MCDWMWYGIRMEVVNVLIVLSSIDIFLIGYMGDWLKELW